MSLGVVLVVLAVVAVLGALYAYVAPRLGSGSPDATRELAYALYKEVADEVGGLVVDETKEGWPRLVGVREGIAVEIDHRNDVAYGLESLLGLRCAIPGAAHAPDAAIWVGEVATLHSQYGRPRALGDADALFEVYTRAEPSASDWWHEPELLETLRALPGAGLLFFEGQLTVVFADLDAHSVELALRVPQLLLQGVDRVTLH